MHIIIYVRLVTVLFHCLASSSVSFLYIMNEKQLIQSYLGAEMQSGSRDTTGKGHFTD